MQELPIELARRRGRRRRRRGPARTLRRRVRAPLRRGRPRGLPGDRGLRDPRRGHRAARLRAPLTGRERRRRPARSHETRDGVLARRARVGRHRGLRRRLGRRRPRSRARDRGAAAHRRSSVARGQHVRTRPGRQPRTLETIWMAPCTARPRRRRSASGTGAAQLHPAEPAADPGRR